MFIPKTRNFHNFYPLIKLTNLVPLPHKVRENLYSVTKMYIAWFVQTICRVGTYVLLASHYPRKGKPPSPFPDFQYAPLGSGSSYIAINAGFPVYENYAHGEHPILESTVSKMGGSDVFLVKSLFPRQ